MSRVGQFVLRSGRTVYLRSLKQWEFYEGLLEGLPTVEMNRKALARIIAENQQPYGEPHLIQPKEESVEYIEGKVYPFGTPAAFPGVTCVGRFNSLSPARDKAKDYSGLVVIWFQHDFAFPIDAEVLKNLEVIDWEKHAVDMEY